MTKPSSGLFQLHLRVRTDPSDILPSLSLGFCLCVGMKTYLISTRKLEPHAHCSCTQLGLSGPEHAEPQYPMPTVHTPDGTNSICSTATDRVKVSAYFVWENSISNQSSHIYVSWSSLTKEYQPPWCSCFCSLCAFVFVGVPEDFLHAKSFFLSCVEGLKKKQTVNTN